MANPLFNSFGNKNPYSAIIEQAQNLKKTLPNPKAEVERLLSTGQMSQEQFNTLVQQARQILPHIK